VIVKVLFSVADVSPKIVSVVVAELPMLRGESAAADTSSGYIITGIFLTSDLNLDLNHTSEFG